ncbi:uncharacterized protein LOC142599860 isoform X1 [Balearica regulorum gibbericeps]|uniref:uncharacterized protein LOC142599683 isoform X1 n=1 Tax=Balearica regulorum gibbericeps TaxID=100784 RepID=UPI003F636F75
MKAWLQEDKRYNEVLRQEIGQLEEAVEQEEIWGAQSLPGVGYVWKGTPRVAVEVRNSSNQALLPAGSSRGRRRQRRRRLCCRRWWKHSWRGTCWQGDVASRIGCSECPLWVPWGPLPGSGCDGPHTCSSRRGSQVQAAGELLAGCGLCRWRVLSVRLPWAGAFSQACGVSCPTLPEAATRNGWGGSPRDSQDSPLHPIGKMGWRCIHPALSPIPLLPHRILCLLLLGLQLAVGFALAAAVLYAASYDPELFYRLLPHLLCEETYTHLAYALGKILPVASEGLLPF